MNWNHKDVWKTQEQTFCVEVTRHTGSQSGYEEGPHRWAVYAYIYPSHPLFKEFSGPSMLQKATDDLPLHAGCSYLKYHRDEKGITSVQVGADYHHLHDDRFTHCATKEEAGEVFEDAEYLAVVLKAQVVQATINVPTTEDISTPPIL